MKDDVVVPKRLVNIKQLDGLRGVTYQAGNGLRLGALATLAEIADNAAVREHYPVLADAADRSSQSADPKPGHYRRQYVPAPARLVLP